MYTLRKNPIRSKRIPPWHPAVFAIDRIIPGIERISGKKTNRKVIRVLALPRSGHHAVISWIIYQHGEKYCFLNNPVVEENPFLTAREVGSDLAGEGRLSGVDMAILRARRKDLMIYNREGFPLERGAAIGWAEAPNRHIGKSGNRTTVLILRDAFNFLASVMRWSRGTRHQPDRRAIANLVEQWKDHAREYLGETTFLREKVKINYNLWFSEEDYRKQLAEEIGFRFKPGGTKGVPKVGPVVWGDTFDGMRFDGRAQEMKVMERWKHFEEDPFYRELFLDSEVAELSEKIFGHIPGTENL